MSVILLVHFSFIVLLLRQAHCVVQAGLELAALLPLSPKKENGSQVPPHLHLQLLSVKFMSSRTSSVHVSPCNIPLSQESF